MRIAVSTDDDRGLQSVVSHHFGRCPYYVLVDVDGTEVKSVRTVANPFFGNHQPGQVPRFIREQGADVMVTGGMGRRAIAFFQQDNIEAVTGAYGTVAQSLAQYLGGELKGAEPCRTSTEHRHEDHEARMLPGHNGTYEHDAVSRLQEEVESLMEQLAAVQDRISRLKAGPSDG